MSAKPTPDANPAPGPTHLRIHSPAEVPADFVALRLILQPAGTVVEINRPEMLVGRHTDSDIRLPLPDVSRRHCRLSFESGEWNVDDLNSLNGTRVNDEAIHRAPIRHGDLLKIGGFVFFVEIPSQASNYDSSSHVRSILETLTATPQRKAS